MPLARAKDSFLNLREVQQAQWEEQRAKQADAATNRDALEWYSDQDPSLFWDPPKDPLDFEQIVPLDDPQKRKLWKCCWLPCWSWKSMSPPPQGDISDVSTGTESESWNFESEDIGSGWSSSDASTLVTNIQARSGGIVRRASLAMQLTLGLPNARRKSYHPATYQPRSSRDVENLHVSFDPKKRVVTIRPLSLMSMDEKQSVWWQYDDYDAFQIETILLIREEEADQELSAIWLAGMKGKADGNLPQEADDDDNWWHKYKHSRRGLERYVSPEEAKDIQHWYKTALNVVLKEQWRQRNWVRHDPEKLAALYHEYTVWSRDLALAAGASDADAVECDFDDSKRKSREYFLLKQLVRSGGQHQHTPSFMLPSPSGTKVKKYLDE